MATIQGTVFFGPDSPNGAKDGDAWRNQTTGELRYYAGGAWQPADSIETAPVIITGPTSPQLQVGYDGSNYMTVAVASNGATTFDAVGAGHAFTFSDPVTVSGNVAVTGTAIVTSAAAAAFAIGPNGATTPAFVVDASAAVLVTGLKVTGAATGGTVAIAVTQASGNANLTVDAIGSGTITLGGTSTGSVIIGNWVGTYKDTIGSGAGTVKGGVAPTATGRIGFDGSGTLTGLDLIGLNSGSTAIRYAAIIADFVVNTAGSETGYVSFWTKPSGAGVTEKMRISSTGGVSIGSTTDPGAGALSTTSTINGQTISATASFTGTVTAATGLAVTTGGMTFTTSVSSVTALATPGAYAATTGTVFASTVSGATLMGFGTTGDVTLKNRAGTDVVVVTSNTLNVTMAGALAISGALSGVTTLASGTQTVTGAVNASTGIAVGATYSSGNGVFVQNASTNNAISTASQGAATTTLYVGNAAITVVSDVRLKRDIVPTMIDALDLIGRLKVVDYAWDDPSDTAPVNKNSRGRWTGLLAQDLIDVVPWVVNAEDRTCRECRAGLPCQRHQSFWHVDLDHMVPLLARGIQDLTRRVTMLEHPRVYA